MDKRTVATTKPVALEAAKGRNVCIIMHPTADDVEIESFPPLTGYLFASTIATNTASPTRNYFQQFPAAASTTSSSILPGTNLTMKMCI